MRVFVAVDLDDALKDRLASYSHGMRQKLALVAALLTFPLSQLPEPFGGILPFVAVVLFGYFGVALFVMRQSDMLNVLTAIFGRNGEGEKLAPFRLDLGRLSFGFSYPTLVGIR